MIDFDLSEEHHILEQTVRDWGAREVAPRIRDLDREHKFDRGILPQMAKLGLLGASVPTQYGGAGMDYISLGLVSEELEYVDTSLRVIMSVHAGLNCLTLLVLGHRRSEAALPRAAGAGAEDRDLRADGTVGRQRRPRHPDRRGEEGRPLRAYRRKDVDLARRRRRQLPGVRVDRSREEESSATRPASARSSSSGRSRGSRAAR